MPATLTAFRQFCLYPIFVRQLHCYGIAHHEVQLAQGIVGEGWHVKEC